MAENLSIAEAEEAYAAAVADWNIRKSKWSFRMKLVAGLLFVAAAVAALLMFTASLWFGLMLFATLMFGILLFTLSDDGPLEGGYELEAERLRIAQKEWVESHGLELPQGAFGKLGFPDLLDTEAPQNYGVTQLIDTRTDSLVSVVLRSTPEDGYRLFGTDGEILKPVLATA